MKTAPIVIFVYNRIWHTRQVLESLQRNEYAVESDLFIYSDGPRDPESVEKVKEVRDYCQRLHGFKTVTVIARETNFGLAQSIIGGITEMLAAYDQVIILEDDLVTSPYFLRYMNEALDLYRNDNRVVSIHGYIYPVRGRLPATFFLRDTGCWGWATWRRGWELFEADAGKLLAEIKRRRITYQFDMDGSYGFTRMLRQQVTGQIDTWDIRWQASAFLEGKLTLFPGVSLVKNIGHDNSGTHSTDSNFFDVQLAEAPVRVEVIPVEEHLDARRKLRNYFIGLHNSPLVRCAHRIAAELRGIIRI